MTIQMKVTEQYFPVVLFATMCKVLLTFPFVDEILKCDIRLKVIEQNVPVRCHYVAEGLTFDFMEEIQTRPLQ